MKKLFSMLLISVLLCGLLCSCGEKVLELNTVDVATIALSADSGATVTLNKAEDVTSVRLALENANCKTSNTAKEALPDVQYRFTTYKEDGTALNTFALFSNEYLQVDTALYKGELSDLLNSFEAYCKVETLSDLSSVFTISAQDITEIAFYNHTENSFKLITRQEDIQSILSPLQSLKISENTTSGNPSEEYALYVRTNKEDEYLPAVEISRHEGGTLCSVEGKSTQVTNYNWGVLYEKLGYNTMPIKK